MPRERKNRNIVRIVVGGQRGWQVKVSRDGQKFYPYFSDSKFGGTRKALAEAVRVRDLIERDHPRQSPGGRLNVLLPSNTTGIPGVQIRGVNRKGRPTASDARTIAQWCPRPGVVRVRSFSIRKHGRKHALQLAIQARRAGLQERSK